MAVLFSRRPTQIGAGRRSPVSVVFLVVLLVTACKGVGSGPPVSETPLTYPDSPEGDVVDDYHGTAVADPYRWLEVVDADETHAWIDAQNAVSEPVLEQLPAYGHFSDRLAELATLPDPGELRRQGGAWVSRGQTVEGELKLVIRSSLDEPPIYRLDASALGLSEEEQLDGFRLAPGGRRLAFTVSDGGSEFLELRVLDLATGDLLDDRIDNLKFDMPFWTADGQHLVYWRYQNADEDNPLEVDRGGLVAVHRLGASALEDRVLYRDADVAEPGMATWSEVSADGRFIVLLKGNGSSMTLSVIDLTDPLRPNWDAPVVELLDEREGDHAFAGNLGSTLYFRTTRDAPLGRVVAVDVDRPREWRTVIPEDEHLLQHTLVVGGRIVGAYRRHVRSALVVFEPDGTEVREVPLPAPGSTFWYGGSPDAADLTFGFDATSVPPRRIHHDVVTGETRTLATREVTGFDGEDYVSHQVFYESPDGTRVPMFLTYRRGLEQDGSTPTILYGYGAGGAVMAPIFRDDLFAWMEADGRVALANVRGGGEYGEAWYEAGRLQKKQNTYDDFIAAAEYLITERYTSREHLAILGYSNGGMLVGAAMTQRPDLFAAAIPVAGVLDALRFPTTTAGPRWTEGQGDAGIPEQFPWVHAWSPLHRIEDGVCYPATLVMTAANDDLVHASQSYKFTARLQAAQGCEWPTVLRVLESGGHSFILWHQEANASILAFAAWYTGLSVDHQSPKAASAMWSWPERQLSSRLAAIVDALPLHPGDRAGRSRISR